MKKYSHLYCYLLSLLITFSLFSCGKSKPCDDVMALSASFGITEVPGKPIYLSKDPYDTDSVSTSEVKFIANEPGASAYEWKIGTDTRTFEGKELQLNFDNAQEPSVDVTLKITKYSPCYGSDTVKTLTRTFYFRPSQVTGMYEGFFSHSSTRATLKIDADYIHPYYYTWQTSGTAPYFRGPLLTGIPVYDTLFIGTQGREVLNQRIYIKDDLHNDIINKTLKFPEGDIILDANRRELKLSLKVTEIKTNSIKTLSFTGKKIN